ncbi:MAG: DEAD/DEAH box helicase [Planctomycetaceae bacterium]|nr:DEAD/DEAH box helicase [Planctomycetaceae bacterium]
MRTKPSDRLTLRDRLSRLTFLEACKLLGEDGKRLIKAGSAYQVRLPEDVYLGDDLFRVNLGCDNVGRPIVATITLMAEARQRLNTNCTHCGGNCVHVGAALSLALEEKTALGLAAAPPEPRTPVESLSEDELVRRALDERAERAKTEKLKIKTSDADQPWADYSVTSPVSGKTYRVALRGVARGESYCSCPDFRTNTLGTCKHVMSVLAKVKRRFEPRQLRRPYKPRQIAVYVNYLGEPTLRMQAPERLDDDAARLVTPLRDRPIDDLSRLLKAINRLQQLGHEVAIYPDAEQFIQQRLFQQRMCDFVAEIRRDPANHPLRESLLKTRLLPYQLDGVAFAAGAGRAVLADDMGLGKTIQGVGVAELLARQADIRKVLVVCPASLKSQWRGEIERFCDRGVQLILGAGADRGGQYTQDSFYTICNYEQVLRDIDHIERARWDLIVLDEGQRIKNWEAKTSRVIKGLRSPFALVLSGTPLENRLDELYSVVQFIDDRRLGPGFRFFNRHRVVDEKGKVLGYKNLTQLRENLRPVLLRRTRDSVKLELPPRTIEYVRIPPTEEQLELHSTNMRVVASVVRKAFISEMDLLRLRQALLMCRMAADSSLLVTKQPPGASSKLARLEELLDQLFAEEGRKVVLFSEWTSMLDLVEPLLKKRKLPFVRLDGSVPQKERPALVEEFQTNPDCKLFLTTNAGSTGLNLQAANTVINVDLPWNPAVLEQRIARAHRMGQTQPVQVFVLVTEQTIEENLLATLSAKRDLALAALDPEAADDSVEMISGMDQLKQRLEILLGAKAEAPLDVSQQQALEGEIGERAAAHKERVAAAGGEMLGAAFKFLGELVASQAQKPAEPAVAADLRNRLAECVEEDGAGRQRLTVTLPDRAALNHLADALAQLLAVGK